MTTIFRRSADRTDLLQKLATGVGRNVGRDRLTKALVPRFAPGLISGQNVQKSRFSSSSKIGAPSFQRKISMPKFSDAQLLPDPSEIVFGNRITRLVLSGLVFDEL